MRYFSREGNEITYEQWWQHLLDPAYVKVRRHSYGKTDVYTSWIGLQSPYCEKPAIYCTFVRRHDNEHPVISASYWFAPDVTPEQVHAFHMSIVMEVGIPLGRKSAK